jgi:hypothetical protein
MEILVLFGSMQFDSESLFEGTYLNLPSCAGHGVLSAMADAQALSELPCAPAQPTMVSLATRPLGSADRLSTVDHQRPAGEGAREWREQECDGRCDLFCLRDPPVGDAREQRSASCSARRLGPAHSVDARNGESSPGLGSRR